MSLNGDLNDFSLIQLLALVQVTGKTGALTLQRQKETAAIYFENGQLTKVIPPETRYEGLATALHRTGRINRELYDSIGSQGLPSEIAIGLLVEDQGGISREEIVEFVRERSLATLFVLLTWPKGTFRFEVGVAPAEGDILAPTDLAPVLDHGRAYLEEWHVLVSQIPDLDRPLRLLGEPSRPVQEVCLSLSEWRMVAAISQSDSLREVARMLDLDDFAVRQVAYRLFGAGLVEIVEPQPMLIFEPTELFREAGAPATPLAPAEPLQKVEALAFATAPVVQEPQQGKPGPLARLFGRK